MAATAGVLATRPVQAGQHTGGGGEHRGNGGPSPDTPTALALARLLDQVFRLRLGAGRSPGRGGLHIGS
jgi:hypothetical protein